MSFTLTHNQKVSTSESARYFWHKHNRMQRKIEKRFVPKMFYAIKIQIELFINAIHEIGYEYAKANIYNIVDPNPVIKVLKELYLKGAYIEGNYVLNYLKSAQKKQLKRASIGLGFEELATVIDEYFRVRLINQSALPITATTRKMIVHHLLSQVDTGIPLDKAILDFIEYALTGGGAKALIRANGIIQTESTKVMSFGGLIGAYMSGIDLDKVWVTSDDERVRGFPNYYAKYPHVDLDLSKANLLEDFYNGEKIGFPGDPKASIENTARCRCAMYFKEKIKPKPEVTRLLSDFISDFLAGFFIGINFFNQFGKPQEAEEPQNN